MLTKKLGCWSLWYLRWLLFTLLRNEENVEFLFLRFIWFLFSKLSSKRLLLWCVIGETHFLVSFKRRVLTCMFSLLLDDLLPASLATWVGEAFDFFDFFDFLIIWIDELADSICCSTATSKISTTATSAAKQWIS